MDTITLPLEAGADPNSTLPCNLGYRPLHYATLGGFVDVVQLLITFNANANLATNAGYTPLHMCRYDTIAKKLIDAGANVNAQNINGATPLHQASFLGYSAMVQMLLSAHADPNSTINDCNETALYCACEERKIDVVKLLVAAGADINIKSTETGKTAQEIALANGHHAVAELLTAQPHTLTC